MYIDAVCSPSFFPDLILYSYIISVIRLFVLHFSYMTLYTSDDLYLCLFCKYVPLVPNKLSWLNKLNLFTGTVTMMTASTIMITMIIMIIMIIMTTTTRNNFSIPKQTNLSQYGGRMKYLDFSY